MSKTSLDVELLKAFNSRYDAIFTNPVMKAAIYLDPRFRKEIIRDQDVVEIAKNTIIDIQKRLQFLHSREVPEPAENSANISSDDSFEIDFDSESAMNNYLGNRRTTELNNMSNFDATLDAFDPPCMQLNASVIEYWHSENDFVELHDVAMAIFAIPPTKVQVERDFSKLKYILSDLRTMLSPQNLENILTINLNQELYHKVNAKQLEDFRQTLK